MIWRRLLKRIAHNALPLRIFGGIETVDLIRHSAIVDHGWLLSRKRGIPVDNEGGPLPWYTYSTIAFLLSRLPPDIDVFEYGCGLSTLWWMRRARLVISVEHAGPWAESIRLKAESNVQIIDVPSGQDEVYANTIASVGWLFDVIIVDGENREACLQLAPNYLKPDGIIILDNSDRPQYHGAISHLRNANFRCVDFIGMGPINTYDWMTSIFYRNSNRLGL